MNYRGIYPAHIVTVLEGNGTESSPYKNVEYVIRYENINGFTRLVTLGVVTPLTEEQKNNFDK